MIYLKLEKDINKVLDFKVCLNRALPDIAMKIFSATHFLNSNTRLPTQAKLLLR